MTSRLLKTKKKTIRPVSTQSIARRRLNMKLLQNIRLIWLDANVNDKTPDNENTIKQLQQMINTITLFTDSEDCIRYLEGIHDERICMIISGSLCRKIVPRIHDMSQLDSIFIFCMKEKKHEKWIQNWSKIKGVFTDINLICDTLEQSIKAYERHAISFSVMNTDQDISKRNLDQLDPMFMYTQILKEILLTIDFEDKHILEFTQYCRQTLPQDNTKEFEYIRMLECEYRSKTPIWWYTLESFLYRMLNRALGVFQIEVMIKMGFFINDLYRHIAELHKKQFVDANVKEKFIAYRGQGMLKEKFEEISKSQGGLFAFNNFLSTTKTESIARRFIKNALRDPKKIGVLFVMNIDPSQTTTPFASVGDVGYFKNKEDEILFAMHTVFRIQNIQPTDDNSRLFRVELQLTNDNDKDLQILTNHIRRETFPDKCGWERLGEVLVKKLQQPIEGEKVYQILLQQETEECRKGYLYNRLGLCKYQQEQHEEAIEFYQKSIEIYKTYAPNDSNLAKPYRNMGIIHWKMGQFQQALQYHEKDNEIIRKTLSLDDPDLAASYNNIGLVYKSMGEYAKALSYYEKDLEISQKLLPSNHPDLALSHTNIGNVFYKLGEYEKALSSYEKTLIIQQQSLPSNHPNLQISHKNIAMASSMMKNHSQASLLQQKSYEQNENSPRKKTKISTN